MERHSPRMRQAQAAKARGAGTNNSCGTTVMLKAAGRSTVTVGKARPRGNSAASLTAATTDVLILFSRTQGQGDARRRQFADADLPAAAGGAGRDLCHAAAHQARH